MIKMHLPKRSFCCGEVEVEHNFSDQDLCQLEAEFLFFQFFNLDAMSEETLKEAAIHHGAEEHTVFYWIDVLWYHLLLQKILGTSWSKFHHLLNLVRVVLCIIHSKREKESVFSRVKKNLILRRASSDLDGTFSNIASFQLNRPVGEKCYQY